MRHPGAALSQTRPGRNGKSEVSASAAGLPGFSQRRLEERWQAYRKALKRSRKKFSEDSVHDLRVETRRMLALLDLLHPFCPRQCLEKVERRFTKLHKNSAALRDTQVQMRCLEKKLKVYPELAPFRKWLRRREKRLARRFNKSVRGGVKPKLKQALGALRKWCRRWMEEPASVSYDSSMFLEQITSAQARLLRLRKAVQANKPSTIHRLRIAFKAYRYMLETLHPEIIRVAPQSLTQLHRYQAMTGQIQDVEVLLATLAEFAKAKGKADITRFRAELRRRHEELIHRFLAVPLPCASLQLTSG